MAYTCFLTTFLALFLFRGSPSCVCVDALACVWLSQGHVYVCMCELLLLCYVYAACTCDFHVLLEHGRMGAVCLCCANI